MTPVFLENSNIQKYGMREKIRGEKRTPFTLFVDKSVNYGRYQ
jgi:hypothetical protein